MTQVRVMRRFWRTACLYAVIAVLMLVGAVFLFLNGTWGASASFFGVLFYAYWFSVRQTWFWKGLFAILPLHAAIVFGLIKLTYALPKIDKLPGGVYALLLLLAYGEWIVANELMELLRRRRRAAMRNGKQGLTS